MHSVKIVLLIGHTGKTGYQCALCFLLPASIFLFIFLGKILKVVTSEVKGSNPGHNDRETEIERESPNNKNVI